MLLMSLLYTFLCLPCNLSRSTSSYYKTIVVRTSLFFWTVINIFIVHSDLWKVRLKHDQLLPAGFAFAGWMGATSHLVVVKDNVIYWTKDATCRSQWQLRSRYVNTKDYYVGLPDWTYAGEFESS